MDIELLSKMVKEIILDHDRVTLPGLGSFVAETVPSTFADKGYTINPPYRRLSFRSSEGVDTLLPDFYASANGVDVHVALSALKDFVAELKEVLQVKKTVVFPGLGRLRATKENNFFFVADEDLDIYPAGFGLEPVSLKTHVETKDEVAAAIGELTAFINEDIPAEVMPESRPEDVRIEECVQAVPSGVQEEAPHDLMSGGLADAVVSPDVSPGDNAVEDVLGSISGETAGQGYTDHGIHIWRKAGMIVLSVVAAVLILLLAYVVTARIFPDFIDRLLYSAEELDILRMK